MQNQSMLRPIALLLALSTLPLAGCVSGGEESLVDDGPGGPTEQGITLNGVSLNGMALNGMALNGMALNGIGFNGVTFNGITLNGITLNGISMNGVSLNGVAGSISIQLQGGQLVAFPDAATMLGGEALEGATLTGMLSNGSAITLRIDDVTPTADSEIFDYTVSFWNGSTWGSLCGVADGAPVRALVLSGTWDNTSGTATGGSHFDAPGTFTFACKNAALAKCVGLGYVPWRSIEECQGKSCQMVSMRDMHQACTRMLRADYCGDGAPHTENGTLINVWDNFDVQTPDVLMPVKWRDEAEWSANGALCIEQVRWSGAAETYIDQHCPERWTSPSFGCFEGDSTFFTASGYGVSGASRSMLRNQFSHD